MAKRLDIESAATYGNEGVVAVEKVHHRCQGILLVGEHIVGVVDGAAIDEMVGGGSQLVGRGTGNADVQLMVELARVARDNLGVKLLCKSDGMGCLARGGGTENKE